MTAHYRHGLIIGKFYPPHTGHHHLIRHAAANADQVTVVVMAASCESIPLSSRVEWLTLEHAADTNVTIVGTTCELPVDYDSDPIWAGQIAAMQAAIRTVTDIPVDAVFASEPYGNRLAHEFGAQPVIVDQTRSTFPVSGTAVRASLATHWHDLAPATRAGLTTRIIVLGAESTGTTTLSQALADTIRARGGIWADTGWVREYGRDYTWEKVAAHPDIPMQDLTWTADDFAVIAKTQQAMEDEAARYGSPVLICDTDAFATRIWERRYSGTHAALHAVPTLPGRAVYLLTDHTGVPFEQDGIRDGEHLREQMTGWFIDALTTAGAPWALITGTPDERLHTALTIVDRLTAERAAFHDPLG